MKTRMNINSLLVFLGLGFAALGFARAAAAAPPMMAPSIDGTYKFVERDLPDGTKVHPPDVVGLLTLSHGYRNFNVYWHDANGNRVSISYIATYKLTPMEYSETSLYYMVHDETSDEPISYDLTESTKSSPVTVKAGQISFQFPNHGEPSVVFDGQGLTATRAGVFVDHWVKVR
jgi:hypothetical protein